ncbi:GGDEF domain-containing response regulator [Deinococcus hopiensis]|uniref:Response regulator receiver domain-containing protein n=1 Tax=Deinococcus hopiensis KR-140 TaxID=695939 RepID=A0A1W1VGI4_9DEIO|nr:diguanylate cyclase [Deinococcus hopiensis]SMB92472.1 Response regulator receiver domain-containing protein [Deinococcus hopiensis KR-140]
MARIRSQTQASGHTILVVDDDADLRTTVTRLLQIDGHEVLAAEDGSEALRLCRERDIHLMLLDYFMPGMTGEEVVRHVRAFDPRLQIVLQTGYASEKPPRQMLRELDIQGYHDKSEGPEGLLVWVDAALKTFRHVRALHASRDGLDYILRVTPELHRLQPLEDLLHGILLQIQGILGFSSALVATVLSPPTPEVPSALVATPEDREFVIRLGTGRYETGHWGTLSGHEQHLVREAAQSGQTQRDTQMALPLRVGERAVGVVLVDTTFSPQTDLHLLELFATQAAVAIENARLYSLATVDDLTGLANKRAWLGRLAETMHLAARHDFPVSVLVLDIDHFKRVNDSYGHLAGDRLLAELGGVLAGGLRRSDVAGRYGGEELVVLLPHTDAAGAGVIAERLRLAVSGLRVPWEEAGLQVTVSIGVATRRGEEVGPDLLARADAALYAAKRAGRNRVVQAPSAAQEAGEPRA